MKISDLLRKAADAMDASEASVFPDDGVDTINDGPEPESPTMVPPLQQKHELLKKVSDVANDTEKFDNPDEEDIDAPGINLDILKQLSGLGSVTQEDSEAAAHFIADDHESD